MTDIEIRRVEVSDAKALKEIYECESAYSGTLQLPLPSVGLWEKRLAGLADNTYSYVAIIGGEIVGNIVLDVCSGARRRHVATLGMGVKDSFQGRGVGSALLAVVIQLADGWINLKRLELAVFIDNTRAIELYKRFGFEIEGQSRAYAFRNGAYVDVFHMGRVTGA